jgi:hypothetical protein
MASMITDSLRPILFVAAGMVVGFLVAWGLFERLSSKSAGASVLPAPTSLTASSQQLTSKASRSPTEENVATETNPSEMVSPSASPVVQGNELPLGVTQDSLNYNKELYQKYPGLNPPQINTDGRDLAPEASQQMQAPPILLSNPTPSPEVSASPFPLVLPNRPSAQSALPLPKQ